MLIQLDRADGAPLYLQLYRALRDQILNGTLPSGHRMPATRRLAEELGTARNVVVLAYDQLESDGYLSGRHGSGTYVAELPAGAAARPGPPPGRVFLPPLHPAVPLAYDFKTGLPDVAAFPRALWGRLLQSALQAMPDQALGYGPIAGSPALREALAGHLGRNRGVRTAPAQVAVTSGSTQALAILAEMLVSPGDVVAVENPSHIAARLVFRRRGARLLPIPVDEEGIRVADLAAAGVAPRVIYVTPSHQFPWASVMSLARRTALIDLARRTGAIVIEDDYDSEIRHSGSPVPALQGLAPESVAYVGSFSKLLAPTLRLGYAVLPRALARPFVRFKQLSDYHSPGIEQEAMAAFMTEGHLERHLHRVRHTYQARRQALTAALTAAFRGRAVVHGDQTGLHVGLKLETAWTGRALASAAKRAGVGVYPLEIYWEGPGIPSGCHLFLGYGSLPEPAIHQGVRLLAEVERTRH
ncbi:MAG TPA: PLP-dependent aminotransferase family protein [Symbiobacteriaceae bacterium]|jgi:GntR family transcriptional regulator/MocR family aminotransferase